MIRDYEETGLRYGLVNVKLGLHHVFGCGGNKSTILSSC